MTEPHTPQPPDEQELQREAEAIGRLYRQTRAMPPPELSSRIAAEVDRALAAGPASVARPHRRRQLTPAWALAASMGFVALLLGVLRNPAPDNGAGLALPADAPELADLLRQRGGAMPLTGGDYLGESGAQLSLAPQASGDFAVQLTAPSGDALGGHAQRAGATFTLEAGSPQQPCRLELWPEGQDLRLRSQGCADTIAANAMLDGRFRYRSLPP